MRGAGAGARSAQQRRIGGAARTLREQDRVLGGAAALHPRVRRGHHLA